MFEKNKQQYNDNDNDNNGDEKRIDAQGWTQEQQIALEQALASAKGKQMSATEKWSFVASQVPGKTRTECVARFKELQQTLRQQRELQEKKKREREFLEARQRDVRWQLELEQERAARRREEEEQLAQANESDTKIELNPQRKGSSGCLFHTQYTQYT